MVALSAKTNQVFHNCIFGFFTLNGGGQLSSISLALWKSGRARSAVDTIRPIATVRKRSNSVVHGNRVRKGVTTAAKPELMAFLSFDRGEGQ